MDPREISFDLVDDPDFENCLNLSHPRSSLPLPPPPSQLSDDHRRRIYRQSLHLQPAHSQLLLSDQQNATPPSPLTVDAPAARPLSQNSDMSIFALFTKPKVEKARGYAEQGLVVPPPLATEGLHAVEPEPVVHVHPYDASSRSASAMSSRKVGSGSTAKVNARDASTTHSMSLDPPPLFQAYAQSRKHAVLEVTMSTAETVLQKSKGRKVSGSQPMSSHPSPRNSMEAAPSLDLKRPAKTTLRHVATTSFAHVDIPRKFVILIASGYLLQYAENGPSDRLPEKVLQLGTDSAAFACDLLPGKHYVLQVSSTVSQQPAARSGSLFAKLGFRNPANKRVAMNLLLVMPSAEDMDSWMMAIRQEIGSLGGCSPRSDTAMQMRSRSAMDGDSGPEQTPRRKPTLVSEASVEGLTDLPLPTEIREEDEGSETATIDGIEQAAAQLAIHVDSSSTRPHQEADVQSLTSSVAASVDQQRLNSLRSHDRLSRATVATTVATSRTNSLSGSPPLDPTLRDSSEATRDPSPLNFSYRTLSSYTKSRRRSAMPVPREPLPTLGLSAPTQAQHALDPPLESPVTGRHSPLPALPATQRSIGMTSRESNSSTAAETRAKHDSKMSGPPDLPEKSTRRESLLGDLPQSFPWMSERPLDERTSAVESSVQPSDPSVGNAPKRSRTPQPSRQPRKLSTPPLTFPLKINPSSPAHGRLPSPCKAGSMFNRLESAGEERAVHTLTAKVDASRSPSVSPVRRTPESPKPDVPSRHPAHTPASRLSLFPPRLPPSPVPTLPASRSPTSSATFQPSQAQAQANGPTLKRPPSIQIRADHAPFLKSIRRPTATPPPPATQARSFTSPIRRLKPSRSSPYLGTAGPPDPHAQSTSALPLAAPPLPEEAADMAMPLPERSVSPLPSRSASRASGRRPRARTSLPQLDLGIPIVGLGPPAPPPSVPLPLPPAASRSVSPMLSGSRTPASRSVSPMPSGLGIEV